MAGGGGIVYFFVSKYTEEDGLVMTRTRNFHYTSAGPMHTCVRWAQSFCRVHCQVCHNHIVQHLVSLFSWKGPRPYSKIYIRIGYMKIYGEMSIDFSSFLRLNFYLRRDYFIYIFEYLRFFSLFLTTYRNIYFWVRQSLLLIGALILDMQSHGPSHV